MKKQRLFFLVLLFSLAPARALPFIHVFPTVAEYTTGPGGKVKGVFTIENSSNEDVLVTTEVKEWWGDQTGLPALEPKKWLKVKMPASFHMKPKSQRVIRYVAHVPKDWKGGLAAMVFFNKSSRMQGSSSPMNVEMRHGVPIYIYSRGPDDRISLSFDSFQVSTDKKEGGASLIYTIKVLNDGTVHLRPHGVVTVFQGDAVVEAPEIEWGAPAFPTRKQMYQARGKVHPWAPGRYRAHVDLSYEVTFLPPASVQKDFEFDIKDSGEAVLVP